LQNITLSFIIFTNFQPPWAWTSWSCLTCTWIGSLLHPKFWTIKQYGIDFWTSLFWANCEGCESASVSFNWRWDYMAVIIMIKKHKCKEDNSHLQQI
jgi:hypothetical protein